VNVSNLSFNASAEAQANSTQWLSGWQYRKEYNITWSSSADSNLFYDLSALRTTISGNPTDRHAFQPVHNATIVEVDAVVDGAIRKYLAYDSDSKGTQIRLYYTNDTGSFWVPYSGNPILGPSSNNYRWPSVTYVNGTFHMFLTDVTGGTLDRWTSVDGIHYTFVEYVKLGGNQWKNPYIWLNPNDNKWYLYSHDSSGPTEYIEVRRAANIDDLSKESDTLVMNRTGPLGSPTVMYFDSKYWLLAEELTGNVWKIVAFYSTTSPYSGFIQCTNSPVISDDEACPMLFLTEDQAHAYLFDDKDSSNWYQVTREVYINVTRTPTSEYLSDYQMRITTHYGNGVDGEEDVYLSGHSRADFGDVRFTWLNMSAGQEVQCNYWMTKLNISESADFWVRIPEIKSGTNSTIYLYYGESDALTTSNGNATFEFFDDFSGTLDKWTVIGGTWNIANGELIASTTSFGQRIRADNFTVGNNSIHVSVEWISGTYFENGVSVRGQTPHEESNGYTTFLSTWSSDYRHRISKMSSGSEKTLAGQGTGNPLKNVWYDAVFKLYGNTLRSSFSPLYSSEITAIDSSFSNGTLCLFDWSAASEVTHYDNLFVCKYVEPEPAPAGWGGEEVNGVVKIDRVFASATRADVGSVQTVGYHAEWGLNGSDVVGGSIFVNGTEHITNGTGWIIFNVNSTEVARDRWIVTGVNCSGNTHYVQTVGSPSIVWDRIKIADGGITASYVMLGDNATVWFKAFYEYDDEVFDGTKGMLYENGLTMVWSTLNNRWEHCYEATALGSETFAISGVNDTKYGLTGLNDAVGSKVLNIGSLPFSVVSNSTVSELTFNSTGIVLSFTVSGSPGTTGYANITVAKALIRNITELVIYIDGRQTNYTMTSTDFSWELYLTYHHSTHRVIAVLNSSPAAQSVQMPVDKMTLLGLIITLIIIATVLVARKEKRRKPR
jgi:hypothetical protein